MANEQAETEINMESDALFKEESFTDRRVGSIQRLTRVDADGNPVAGGEVLYVGHTQLMTRAGPLPLTFEIAADSLADAAEKFGAGASTAMEDTVKRLEEMQREQASSIIVPGGGGGGGTGGAPGGGSFQLP